MPTIMETVDLLIGILYYLSLSLKLHWEVTQFSPHSKLTLGIVPFVTVTELFSERWLLNIPSPIHSTWVSDGILH